MQHEDFILQEVSEFTQFIDKVLVDAPAADGAERSAGWLDPEGNTFTSMSLGFTVISVWALED